MRKILYIFIVTLLFWSCSSNISYEEQILQYSNLYYQADSLVLHQEYKKAISKLNKAIQITDTLSRAILLKGDCHMSLKEYDKAEDDYTDVIELEGIESIAFKNRAKNYLKQNEKDDFKEDIDNYILYHQADASALLLRTNYYIGEEEYENSILDYSTLIKISPQNANFYLFRGNIYSILEQNTKCIADYEKYILLSGDIDNSNIYYKKALLNFSMNKYPEAIKDFSSVKDTFDKYNDVLAKKGESFFLIGEYDNAIVSYTKYLINNPKDYHILKKRGETYLLIGNKENSNKDIQLSSSIKWGDSSFFYKYSFLVIIIFIFFSLAYFIKFLNKTINDNISSLQIYIYFLLTGIFGGHYVALRFKYRFYFFLALVVALLIYNNYEIISFYNNYDLFISNIKYTVINKILFYTIAVILFIDLITITLLVNYSNYKFQKTISPNKAIDNGQELLDIKQSLISSRFDFTNLKNRYQV